jgi:hypothetical protein
MQIAIVHAGADLGPLEGGPKSVAFPGTMPLIRQDRRRKLGNAREHLTQIIT